MGLVTVGVDIGQKRDPTALAVIECEWRDTGSQDYYLTRHLERLPLGTPYPAVAQRLADVVADVQERGGDPRVYVDATGVGLPVVDLLTAAGVTITPVYFTHGDRRTIKDDGSISLGKAWLVSRLQALLQTGRILLPRTPPAAALAKELQDYEIKVSENANDQYRAFRVGSHDDLVTALGLAVQGDADVPVWVSPVAASNGWYDAPAVMARQAHGQHYRRYRTSDLRAGSYPRE